MRNLSEAPVADSSVRLNPVPASPASSVQSSPALHGARIEARDGGFRKAEDSRPASPNSPTAALLDRAAERLLDSTPSFSELEGWIEEDESKQVVKTSLLEGFERMTSADVIVRGENLQERMPEIEDFLGLTAPEQSIRVRKILDFLYNLDANDPKFVHFFETHDISIIHSTVDEMGPQRGHLPGHIASPEMYHGEVQRLSDLIFSTRDIQDPGYQKLKAAVAEGAEMDEEAIDYLYILLARVEVISSINQYKYIPKKTIRASERLVEIPSIYTPEGKFYPFKCIRIQSHKYTMDLFETPWWQILLFFTYFALMIYYLPTAYDGFLHRYDYLNF